MAEFLWSRTYRASAAVLFASAGFLALLDWVTRPAGGTTAATAIMASLTFVLLALGAVSLRTPIESWEAPKRSLPAAIVAAALLLAVLQADIAQASIDASIGLVLVAVLILTYVGIALSPGLPLVLAPIVLVVLLIAQQRAPDRISLALPLVAVPIAALVAELVSALVDRSRTADSQGQERLERLARLEEVLRRFRRPGSLQQAANQVAVAAREIFDVERSTVVLRDSLGNLLPVSLGPTNDKEPAPAVARLVSETINGDEPRMVPTGTNGTMLVLPLPAAEAPAGAVLVYPVPTNDPEFTLDLARLFGVQIGIAIEHLFVIDELSRANTRDELTGMGNRKHADALLKSLAPGDALIVLDLDGFKSVNDTKGHAAGDAVLQDLSAHLHDCLRDSDTSARLGGDEFLIVARRAHADPLAVADRVLVGWADRSTGTTLSAGVALHRAGDPSERTFERSDRALYTAKAKGKNQAVLWMDADDEGAWPKGSATGPPSAEPEA